MEQYKRFSYKPWPYELAAANLDELVSKTLNDQINSWTTVMKTNHSNFRYRIINADSFLDPRVKTDPGLESASVVIHIAYEV